MLTVHFGLCGFQSSECSRIGFHNLHVKVFKQIPTLQRKMASNSVINRQALSGDE